MSSNYPPGMTAAHWDYVDGSDEPPESFICGAISDHGGEIDDFDGGVSITGVVDIDAVEAAIRADERAKVRAEIETLAKDLKEKWLCRAEKMDDRFPARKGEAWGKVYAANEILSGMGVKVYE